jgi:hypothetical protein
MRAFGRKPDAERAAATRRQSLPRIAVSDVTPPIVTTDDLASLLDAPPETAQRAIRAVGPRSFLGAIRALHEQHETAERAHRSLRGRRIAVSGKTTRPGSQLGAAIRACGAQQVGQNEAWDMLVVGDEPSKRALARAAKDGIAVVGEGDLVAMHALISRLSKRQSASSADAMQRARQEARQLESQRRSTSPAAARSAEDVAARLADVARARQTGSGMHTQQEGARRTAA